MATVLGRELAAVRQSREDAHWGSRLLAAIQSRHIFWASLVVGWLWMLLLLWHSPGTFTQDEIGHFIIARDAWHTPSLILSDWGRAGNTLIYMIPALLGLTGERLAATLMAALTVLFAAKLARKLGAEYYFAVPIVVWFQLWYCDFSHAAITEVPFSLLMVMGAYFFVCGEFPFASIVVGMLPLVRTEGLALALVWAAYCLWKKRWGAATIALFPTALLHLLTRLVLGTTQMGTFANTHPIGNLQMKLFGIGSWSYYPIVLIKNAGFLVLLLAVYALPAILKQSERLLVFAFYGLYLSIHMVLYHFGLYGVGGDYRYVLPLAPAIGVAAAFGLEYVVAAVNQSAATRIMDRTRLAPAALAIVLALVVADGMRYTVRPLDPEAVCARETAAWLREKKLADHPLISTHVYFYYHLPLRVSPRLWQDPAVSTAKPGTIAIWDSHYSEIFGLPLDSLSPAKGWEQLKEFDDTSTKTVIAQARFLVFEKHAAGPVAGNTLTKN